MIKNGKIIKCKVCQKEIYISASRFGYKKYCSVECARKDNFGFKPREKNCIICGKKFIITKGIESQKKTCSNECWKKNNYAISKKRCSEKIEKKCKICGNKYTALKFRIGSSMCSKCRFKKLSDERKGKNNANFKTGIYTNRLRKGSRQSGIHLRACAKYKKEFLKKNNYKFCEVCGVNENGTMRFEVHHIYFASRRPLHKELHNFKNLILVCLECHQKFHSGNDYKEKFLQLEKDRGLKKLFNKQI